MASNQSAVAEHTGNADDALKDQKEKVRRLRKRLHSRETFILPEVWDVVSARVIADAGFDLIGMSPLAIAWGQGLHPKERVPLDMLVGQASKITRNFPVPFIADLEGIVGRSIEEIAKAAETVIKAGCIGIVIGDGGLGGMHGIANSLDMASAIRSVKAAALEAKVPAVITARTEAFLLEPPQQSPFETAVERAEVYFAAGADAISVPGVQHIQIIERLSGVIDGPLSITVGLTPAPDLKAFSAAGVSCVSLGPALMRSLLGIMRLKAEEIVAFGQFNNLDKAISAEELNKLLA
jgi:2-methylisocitrate lyase-like PEP mutase family enzyme